MNGSRIAGQALLVIGSVIVIIVTLLTRLVWLIIKWALVMPVKGLVKLVRNSGRGGAEVQGSQG
jgi:hypothetical protein